MPMPTVVRESREPRVEDVRSGTVVVHVAATLDERAATALEALLDVRLNPVGQLRRLVLDLGEAGAMTEPYLRTLLAVQRRCDARSVRLCLLDSRLPVVELLREAGTSTASTAAPRWTNSLERARGGGRTAPRG